MLANLMMIAVVAKYWRWVGLSSEKYNKLAVFVVTNWSRGAPS